MNMNIKLFRTWALNCGHLLVSQILDFLIVSCRYLGLPTALRDTEFDVTCVPGMVYGVLYRAI